jgi:glycosyltransferase involved in cell wall biosynthesis
MPPSLLLDLTNTSHTRARTGVQRVARSLTAALGNRALAICYDPYQGNWRGLEDWERDNLTATEPGKSRGSRWPWRIRAGAALRQFAGPGPGQPSPGRVGIEPGQAGLLVPEVFSAEVGGALAPLLARVNGPRVAIFHDAIPLQLPDLTPPNTVARFPSYLRELLRFDGIAATSRDSQQKLIEYWRWLGVESPPPVVSILLGADLPAETALPGNNPAAPGTPPDPVILCVGSIEGRKNHSALLDACESLWVRGLRFELRLIGLARPQTGGPALKKIAALQAAGRALRYDGPVDDAELGEAYRQCAFSVFPSLLEGFGLPVFESLARGRPCVCSGRGALGEAAQGGGCLTLPQVDARSLAGAIEFLLKDGTALPRLGAEAARRHFKTWADYAHELEGWIPTLSRR